jgi:hypothetical protein
MGLRLRSAWQKRVEEKISENLFNLLNLRAYMQRNFRNELQEFPRIDKVVGYYAV